ncbi:MAG: hypothetical protein Q9199_005114 [Rusavskia elegans]
MPLTSAAAKSPTSIDVNMAILFFRRHYTSKTERLPNLPAAGLGESNVSPVTFDQDSISFTQKANGSSCVVRLAKRDYTLQSLAFETPFMAPRDDESVIVASIVCHSQPKCEITPSKRKNGMLEARKIPLRKLASEMYIVRIELSEALCYWKVRGATKGKTLAAVKSQLDHVCVGYNSTPVAESWGPSQLKAALYSEDKDSGKGFIISRPKLLAMSTAAGHPPRPASSNPPQSNRCTLNQQSIVETVELNCPPRPASSNPPHPASNNQPSSNPLPTDLTSPGKLPHQAPPTLTAQQHPTGLKRKLEEMKTQYDEIEKEEKNFMLRSREKKEKLWQELHSAGV